MVAPTERNYAAAKKYKPQRVVQFLASLAMVGYPHNYTQECDCAYCMYFAVIPHDTSVGTTSFQVGGSMSQNAGQPVIHTSGTYVATAVQHTGNNGSVQLAGVGEFFVFKCIRYILVTVNF